MSAARTNKAYYGVLALSWNAAVFESASQVGGEKARSQVNTVRAVS